MLMAPNNSEGDLTVLLAEINHRLFNSFQVITSLTARSRRAQTSSELGPILDDLDARVQNLSRLHRQLASPIASENFRQHCLSICRDLIRGFGRGDKVRLRSPSLNLSRNETRLVSLAVVEMVTNALKHSMHGSADGTIFVELAADGDSVELLVFDNLLTACPSPTPSPSRTVKALASGLGGSAFVLDRGRYIAALRFPPETAAPHRAAPALGQREVAHVDA